MLCAPRSVPTIIFVTIVTTQNIKNSTHLQNIGIQQKHQQTLCIIRTHKHNETQQSYDVFQNPKNWILITHCPTYLEHQKIEIPFTLKLIPNLPQITYNN